MNDIALAGRQVREELRNQRRNINALIFTMVFPIMFLLVFGFLNNGNKLDGRSGLPYIQFYVPGILTFSITSACYSNLAIRITNLRDQGVLKRLRGTPLPSWAYMTGHIGASIGLTAILVVASLVIGISVFDVHIYARNLPALVIYMVVGAATMCSLGLALSSKIPNSETMAPIVQFVQWPVIFISNVFFPIGGSGLINNIASALPIKPLADGLGSAFDPTIKAPGIHWSGLGILGIWLVIGLSVSIRHFTWDSGK